MKKNYTHHFCSKRIGLLLLVFMCLFHIDQICGQIQFRYYIYPDKDNVVTTEFVIKCDSVVIDGVIYRFHPGEPLELQWDPTAGEGALGYHTFPQRLHLPGGYFIAEKYNDDLCSDAVLRGSLSGSYSISSGKDFTISFNCGRGQNREDAEMQADAALSSMDIVYFDGAVKEYLRWEDFTFPVKDVAPDLFRGKKGLKTVRIVGNPPLTYTGYMFADCTNLKFVDFGDFDASNVTNMCSMFYDCSALTSLNLSRFNTSKVTDMGYMFGGCSSLKSLDLSNFDTSSLTRMCDMFEGCSSLSSLDLSNFKTNKVTEMSFLFHGCSSLINLNLSNFDTNNVTSMCSMFYDCSALTSLNLSRFNTSKVTDMGYMFGGCGSLKSLDLSNFDTSSLIRICSMFERCSSLSSLDLGNFKTNKVTEMSFLFHECSALTNLNLGNFDTSNVTYMSGMFSGCSSLTSLDLINFDTSKVTDMNHMFVGCSSLKTLNLTSFNTSHVTDMNCMFLGCEALMSLDVSSFNTSHVNDMHCMFERCNALRSINLNNFNTSNVTNMSCMFARSGALTSLDLMNFDFSKVTSISEMFGSCTSLGTIYCKADLSGVEDGDFVFANCSFLEGGNGTSYDYDRSDKAFARPDKEGQPGYFTDDINYTRVYMYARLSGDDSGMTMTFYYDTNITATDYIVSDGWYMSWEGERNHITHVVFDSSFANARPQSTARWFCSFENLQSIEGLDNLNTSQVTDMSQMFQGCSSLTSVNLLSFDFSQVKNINDLFGYCTMLQTIYCKDDLSGVESGDYVFLNCEALIGGNETYYDFNIYDKTYARPDLDGQPGYFSVSTESDNKETVADLRVNDTFKTGGINYQVISIAPLEVQLYSKEGWPIERAIDQGRVGQIDIPSIVKGPDGRSYSVTTIGRNAFSGCSGVRSFSIPESVKKIEYGAFTNCSGLTQIVIPNSVTFIDQGAFQSCSNLESVILSKAMTRLESGMFYNCTSLKIFVIPNTITEIGAMAFRDCMGLQSITIPSSVQKLEDGAFWGCASLSSIAVEKGNTVFDSRDGCNGVVETKKNELILGCKNTVIPSSVTSIGQLAFYGCKNLITFQVPSFVTKIGYGAFMDCDRLSSIYIPRSVESIGDAVLNSCASLASIIVEKENENYDSREDCNAIIEKQTNELIAGCKTTIIPSSVTSISWRAFWGSGLSSIEIPQTVKSIGSNAFSNCESLKTITIPNSINTIENHTFAYCYELYSLVIPSTVQTIGVGFIYGCDKLRSIKYDASYPAAFDPGGGWAGIAKTRVYVPYGTKSRYESTAGWNLFKIIEAYEDEGFEYSLTGDATVAACGKLLPQEVTEIPETMTIDGKSYAVTSIVEGAFRDNKELTFVSIPESIGLIGESAFAGCSDLKAIYCYAEDPIALGSESAKVRTRADGDEMAASSVFAAVDKEICILYVPKSSGDKYRAAEGWREFKNIVEIQSDEAGDANNDGKVDDRDVQAVSKYIMDGNANGFIFKNADVNGDKKVNIVDIVLINKIR